MINLRLAEYDLEKRKFKRFLEFNQFMISEDYLIDLKALNKSNDTYSSSNYHYSFFQSNKDNKDPLNRFGGLFNGRTYGKGKFVLMVRNEDIIVQSPDSGNYYYGKRPFTHEKGNLHENPELINSIKGYNAK